MSFEINRYNGGGGPARRTNSQLARMDEAARVVLHQIQTTTEVGKGALTELTIFHMVAAASAGVAPSGTAVYDAIAREISMQVVASLRQFGYRIQQ